MTRLAFLQRLEERGIHADAVDVPIMGPVLDLLDEAREAIVRLTDHDGCGCDDEDCTDETPKCDTAKARRVARKIVDDIFVPKGRSLNPERLSSPAERIYFDHWQKQNERQPGLNHGYGALELILMPTRDSNRRYVGDRMEFVPLVSQRDADVAATLMQWLGTSGGRCFIETAEREIERANAERRDFEHERLGRMNELNGHGRSRTLPVHENAAMMTLQNLGIRSDHPHYKSGLSILTAAIATLQAEATFDGV